MPERSPCHNCFFHRLIKTLDVSKLYYRPTVSKKGGNPFGRLSADDQGLIRPCQECEKRLAYADSVCDGVETPDTFSAFLYATAFYGDQVCGVQL